MIDYIKQQHLSLLIIVFLLAVVGFGGNQSFKLGAIDDLSTISNPVEFTSTGGNKGVTMASTTVTSLKTGVLGTKQAFYAEGTCNLFGGYASAATTTTNFDCAVTGVVSGDTVMVSGPSTLPCVAGSGCISAPKGAYASSTSGYITVPVFNGLGAASSTPTAPMLNGWYYIVSR